MENTNDEMLAIAEAAQELGVSERTLRNWDDNNRLPAIKTSGGHRRWYRSQLQEFKKTASKTEKFLIQIKISSIQNVGKPTVGSETYSIDLKLNHCPVREWLDFFKNELKAFHELSRIVTIHIDNLTIHHTCIENLESQINDLKSVITATNSKMESLNDEITSHDEKVRDYLSRIKL